MQHNGHDPQNNRPAPPTEGQPTNEPRFIEDETGTTLDSGVAICRFSPQLGGRLQQWRWRTLPPLAGMNPTTQHNPPALLDLVQPDAGALIDHFLPLGTKPDEFASGTYEEYGNFVEEPFRAQVIDSGGEIRVALMRDGQISTGKRSAPVLMAKSAAVRPGAADLAAHYRIVNSSLRPIQILFAVEFNLFAPGLYDPEESASHGYYLIDGERPGDSSLAASGLASGATTTALVNPEGEMALQVGWDRECDLWYSPAPEGGPGVKLLSIWRLQLPPRDNWAMGLWLAPG